MEDDESFENSDINNELLGLSKQRKKNIIIYGTIISVLLIACIILSIFFLLKIKTGNDNKNLEDTKAIKVFRNDNNYDSIKRFFALIPFFIKGDCKGECELNRGGLTLNEENPILFLREYSSIVENIKSYQMNKISGKFDTSLSTYITVLYDESNFKLHIENLKKRVYDINSVLLIGKYNLGSLSIKIEDVSISEQLNKKINDIADNSYLSDSWKAKELEKIFESYGYFIPLTIHIGGQFIVDAKEIKRRKDEKFLLDLIAKINQINTKTGTGNTLSHNDIMEEMYSFNKAIITGGDITKTNFNDWISSLTLENCDITAYSNIIPVIDLLDNGLKNKMLRPLKLLETKYNKRKRYIEIIEDLKKRMSSGWKKENIKGSDGDGIVKEEGDLIYLKKYRIQKQWTVLTVESDFRMAFTDIIVGWKITQKKEHNGEWTLKQNPLLNYRMDAHFKSELTRGIYYEISIYLMKYPN